jgi:hypothetical protein
MVKDINEPKTITLVDGREISIRPLKISLLRPFMTKFQSLAEVATDNDKSMDLLIDCVQIAMKQYEPTLADDKAALEELVDLPTVYLIIEEASGVKLSDVANILNT